MCPHLKIFVLIYCVNLTTSEELEPISPMKEFTFMKPDKDNGQAKISSEFKASLNSPNTFDTFLKFLQEKETGVRISLNKTPV